MKAKYIREGRAVNPAFSNKEKRQSKKDGEPYNVSTYVTVPVGFVEEGDLCWVHCCPGHKGEPPMCVAADDECIKKVKNWMEVERPKQLERIRQMLRPANLSKLSKKEQKHVEELAEAYGLTAPETNEPPPLKAEPKKA